MPQRIQRKRTKGWKMPPNTVYVGRPTKWGNGWLMGRDGDAAKCVALYRTQIEGNIWTEPNPRSIKEELRGKNLACWCQLCAFHANGKILGERCRDCAPCHADVLLRIANE